MLKKAFIAAGLSGKIAMHSLRKPFAQPVYEQSGDIYLVKELLGHRNVATTQSYLDVNYVDAREAVEAISLDSESYRPDLLSNSFRFLGGELKKIANEHCFWSSRSVGLRGEETTTEIIKFG